MITQQTPFLLKILSGSNAGALVRLKVGDVEIGRSMSSDIILHDESIAESHLRLKVSSERILMQILASPVLVDSKAIEAQEVVLKPFQVVTLGDVDLFIADVRKPGRRTTRDEAELNQRNSHDSTEAEAAPADVAGNDRGYANQDYSRVTISPDRLSASASSKSKKRRGSKKYLVLGLGLLLLANALYFLPNLLNFAEQVGLKETPQQRAESVVAKLGVDNLKVERTGRDALITGYVPSLEEKRQIMTQVGQLGPGVNYRIWSSDELVSNAERVAHALGQTEVGFKPLQEGRLAAYGFVSNGDDWERLKLNIMEDVNGIQAIEDSEVQTLLKRKQALEQFIEKKGLSSRIRVTIEANQIKVDGELTQSELNRWDDLYQEFLELHGRGPAIVENLYDARDRIKLAIRSVSVGDKPFLVSKDGKKYMEGSSLGRNYFIKKITSDHVLLSNDGAEIPVYYGVEDK